jgi:hypothetical protein
MSVTFSNVAAVAPCASHSGILVIITAMLFTDTRASRPPITARQLASPPARPSGLKREPWERSSRTTGERTRSSSLSGSKRFASSCKKGSTSVGERVVTEEEGVIERRGPERAERDRRGVMSSVGPTGRLR